MAIMKKRPPVAQLGQPVLRQVAKPIAPERIASAEFQRFIDYMFGVLKAEGGVGLAAPQVYVGDRIFLAAVDPGPKGKLEPEVFINPQITPLADDQESRWEGCLSFLELQVLVPRWKKVRIEFLDREGKPRALELENFPARVVQHEYDHLDGVLTLDRAASTRDIIKASELDGVMDATGTKSAAD
ncbi:MAG TPA: peptide deformylase [Planctomycetia bacterium]|nr:peptide deformylase [Planctomycetia bacterium]